MHFFGAPNPGLVPLNKSIMTGHGGMTMCACTCNPCWYTLVLVLPPTFTRFTNRYYAPALGFLMFAVGVNSSEKDFLKAFKRPTSVLAGYTGQFLVKPLLGYVFGFIAVAIFGLPTPVVSNYATFLTGPDSGPSEHCHGIIIYCFCSIYHTILIVISHWKEIVDLRGMVSSIPQIVVTSSFVSKYVMLFGHFCLRYLCVGAPLAINIEPAMSPFGLTVLLLFIACYLTAFIAGCFLTGVVFHTTPDVKALQRTLSYETGMQRNLLALANRFFQDLQSL
ncbi:hypothetical protein ACFX2I_032121 [Malus domestica]